MGLFDVFRSRSKPPATPRHPGTVENKAKAVASNPAIMPLLKESDVPKAITEAKLLLEQKNNEAAIRKVEQILAIAGENGDVIAELSNELGKHGLIEKITELFEHRYDMRRHGPGLGVNLLQAYLVMGDSTKAQEMLEALEKLPIPELKPRLEQLAELLKELVAAEGSGARPMDEGAQTQAETPRISLVTISKPIWFYGLESLQDLLLPPKAAKVKHVAFGQLALLEMQNLGQLMLEPEEELGRLSRALPLWLSETLFFSPQYHSVAALGILENKQQGSHYALFGAEWTTENLQQLIDTNKEPLDYIFTGSLKRVDLDTELIVRLWDAKKLKERKSFTVTWTPSTMDSELKRFHEMIRTFMECIAYPKGQGLPYQAPAVPSAWLDTLGASASLFLVEKAVLPPKRLRSTIEEVEKVGARAAAGNAASLAWITLRKRATALGIKVAAQQPVLASHPLVSKALELKG